MIRKPLLGLCLVAVAALIFGASCAAPAQPAPSAPPPQAVAPTKAPEAPKPAATTAPAPAPAATSAPAAAAKPAAPAASFKTPQGWPNKPITLIVPWPGGGGADASMRLLGSYLESVLGVSVQVLNKPGANSQIGLTELALAKPDGYTMGFVATPSNWTTYLNPSTKAAYNGDSFDMVAFLNSDPGLNFVKADSKYKTLKDLVDDAKARPNQVTITTSGILSPHHLNVVLLEKLTGAKFRIVHFDGAAPEITAVLGGQVEVGTLNVATNLSDHIKNNALRILAVYADQRVKVYPDVPTAKEAGFPVVTSSDRIIAVPKGTPKEIVTSLSRAIEQGTKDADLVEKMGKMGIIFQYKNPEDTAKYWKENESVIKPLMSVMKGE